MATTHLRQVMKAQFSTVSLREAVIIFLGYLAVEASEFVSVLGKGCMHACMLSRFRCVQVFVTCRL